MKTLEQEAEEYAKNSPETPGYKLIFKHSFLAGANSKYVKQQILQAQISLLKSLKFEITIWNNVKPGLLKIIEDLQQQLKELET